MISHHSFLVCVYASVIKTVYSFRVWMNHSKFAMPTGSEGASPGADTGSVGSRNVGPPQPRIASIKQFLDTFLVAEKVKEACFSPQLDKVKKLRLQREERFAALMSANEYVQWNQSKIPLYVQFRMKVKIFCEQL